MVNCAIPRQNRALDWWDLVQGTILPMKPSPSLHNPLKEIYRFLVQNCPELGMLMVTGCYKCIDKDLQF